MKRHAPFPDRDDLHGMSQVVGKIIDEDIAQPPSENHPQGRIFVSERRLLLSPEPSPPASFSGAEPLRLDSSHSPEKMAPVPWHRKVTTRFFLWLFLALSLGFFILGYQIDRAEEKSAVDALSSRLHSESTLLLSALVRFLEKSVW